MSEIQNKENKTNETVDSAIHIPVVSGVWVEVSERLPIEHEEPHKHTLYIETEEYGAFIGFFHNDKFMLNYACEILNVIRWIELPKRK